MEGAATTEVFSVASENGLVESLVNATETQKVGLESIKN
jgi:hypothetical protein